MFLANLLSPVVERVHWLIPPSGTRGPAAAVVYFVLIAILLSVAIPIGAKIAEEAAGLGGTLPAEMQTDPLGQRASAAVAGADPPAPVNQFVRDRVNQFDQNRFFPC